MKLSELREEDLAPKLAVVYGGRFQPPHPGHLKVYNWLAERFGRQNVYMAMSDRINTDPSKGDVSAFTFNERKHLILGLFKDGPRPDHIVKCANPAFKPVEVFKQFPNNKVIYVAATSAKDAGERYARSKFFDEYPMDGDSPDVSENTLATLKPANEGAYYVVVPTFLGGLSGTQVRDALSRGEEEAMALYRKVYGDQADDHLFHQIRQGLNKIKKTDDNA